MLCIKEARKRQKLTQSQLAKLAQVSTSSVIRWENGERSPTVHDLEAIANALGVPVSELVGEHLNPTRRRRSREKSESTATAQA